MMEIDRNKIKLPSLEVTNQALQQFNLMLEHDFTLQDQIIRIYINGKKCEGFVYAIGFDQAHKDDFSIAIEGLNCHIHMDPFCAYYLNSGKIDFYQNFEQDEEGFIITNDAQEKFQGKFWLKDSGKTPPTL